MKDHNHPSTAVETALLSDNVGWAKILLDKEISEATDALEQIGLGVVDRNSNTNPLGRVREKLRRCLGTAAERGNIPMVRLLLPYIKDQGKNEEHHALSHALGSAFGTGRYECAKVLQEAGAKVDQHRGVWALSMAATNRHNLSVRHLLDLGVKPKITCLRQSLDQGNSEAVAMLLENKNWEEGQREKIDYDILAQAIENWDMHSVKIVLQEIQARGEEEKDLSDPENQGNLLASITAAAATGDAELLRKALARGQKAKLPRAKLPLATYNDSEALRAASFGGHTQCVEILLDAGAELSAQSYHSLQWAIASGHKKTAQLLLSRIDTKDLRELIRQHDNDRVIDGITRGTPFSSFFKGELDRRRQLEVARLRQKETELEP